MTESKIGGIKGWLSVVIACGMLCALEIKGYLLVRAGQTVLEIPRSWRYAFSAYCVWLCWEILHAEYKKGGIVSALIKATFECCGIIESLYLFLLGIAGHNILESPPYWKIALYLCAIALLVWGSYFKKKQKNSSLETSDRQTALNSGDRCAALLIAAFFSCKMGMAFVTGSQAIALKGVGCIAIGLGTFLIVFNRLDTLSADEAEFPSISNAFTAQISPATKNRTMME